MKAYTDYPFTSLGDVAGKIAPMREIDIVSYDGDKYCKIIVNGVSEEIKAGYIYTNTKMKAVGKRNLNLLLLSNF